MRILSFFVLPPISVIIALPNPWIDNKSPLSSWKSAASITVWLTLTRFLSISCLAIERYELSLSKLHLISKRSQLYYELSNSLLIVSYLQ